MGPKGRSLPVPTASVDLAPSGTPTRDFLSIAGYPSLWSESLVDVGRPVEPMMGVTARPQPLQTEVALVDVFRICTEHGFT